MSNRLPITLDTLLTGDRTRFQRCPGDEEIPSTLTVAEVKDLVVAVNVSGERILDLHQRVSEVEARIPDLEDRLEALEEYRKDGTMKEFFRKEIVAQRKVLTVGLLTMVLYEAVVIGSLMAIARFVLHRDWLSWASDTTMLSIGCVAIVLSLLIEEQCLKRRMITPFHRLACHVASFIFG